MLKGRSSVDSCTILHICMSLLCPQSHLSTASSSTSLMPSTWFITNPDFILKTTFMNHDLGSGGNVGLQISDLDVDKVSPPKHNWWCQKWTHFHHLLWMQTKLFRYIMMVIWDFTTETFVYSQCGCLVGSCLLWYYTAWIWQNVWLADNLNCVIFCYHQMRQPPTCKVEGNLVSNKLMQGFDIFKIRVPVFYRFTMKYSIFQCYHHTDRCSWEIMRVV